MSEATTAIADGDFVEEDQHPDDGKSWAPSSYRPFVLLALYRADQPCTIREVEKLVSSLVHERHCAEALQGVARLDHDIEALRIEGLVIMSGRKLGLSSLGAAALSTVVA